MTTKSRPRRRRRPRGFTLTELLVVVTIVVIVSAVALPTVIPALGNRQVGEGARLVQATLASARDMAIRYNAPRGIRLIPDRYLGNPGNATAAQAASRIVMIEPAPDIVDGLATFVLSTPAKAALPNPTPSWGNASGNPPLYPFPDPLQLQGTTFKSLWSNYPCPMVNTTGFSTQVLIVEQAVGTPAATVVIPNPPTNWFWNVRLGDKFRFHNSGAYYTVVGPMTVPNPEFFVNDGAPGATSSLADTIFDGAGKDHAVNPEFLFLVNGVDDTVPPNGSIDEGFDGLDTNLSASPVPSPWVPTPDDITEWTGEAEQWVGAQAVQFTSAVQSGNVPLGMPYTIKRRPVPVPGAREVALPGSTVIDLTTFNGTYERSRLPVDPISGTVDVMINQAGQVVPVTPYSTPSSVSMAASFYHFWVCDRTDVHDPANNSTLKPPFLPMPSGTPNYPPAWASTALANVSLKKERQLVTLFAKTGQVLTNTIENFDGADINAPYADAQRGVKESK